MTLVGSLVCFVLPAAADFSSNNELVHPELLTGRSMSELDDNR